ncbi:MAG: hypothetical protein LBC98_10030, partial [Prevotellaceae bacterium]|nr:hypothetical protein [Prevotellaceae bacterium]
MNKFTSSLIFSAIFIFAAQQNAKAQQTPGGVSNPNYIWAAWLTPDSYNGSGTWTNLWTGAGTIGN